MVESEDLARLTRILKDEANGKELRRELAKNLRHASEPARDAARSSIMAMESGGLEREGEPLREAIAHRVVTEARLSGRSTGAKVKARRLTQATRGFILAPKRTNATRWRRRVYGRDVWVEQVGKPRWFDDAMDANRSRWRDAVEEAMDHTAHRIAHHMKAGG
jgi:hypothetical protein